MTHVNIFLSAVSAEFRCYRVSLRHDLSRPNLTVKVQEDFIETGEETLDKLDDYILRCNAVVHLVGDMIGTFAQAPSVDVIRQRYPDFVARFPVLEPFLKPGGPALSYTQWEAWLALYHRKPLFIAAPKDGAPRHEDYRLVDSQRANQQAHLALLALNERYPGIHFANADRLAVELLRSRLQDILPPLQIASAVLERLREVAASLLEVGRVTWKTPPFVALLNLDVQEEKADEEKAGNEHRPTNIAALTEAVSMGTNLVLFGEGGIGKTTFLLELSGTLLVAKCPRIPLYIDAAYWARTNTGVLEYIAASPAAQRHGVTVSELVKLADTGRLTLAVNGWNEIPANQKLGCFERFSQLTATIPELNVVLVTRTVKDATNLQAAKHVQVRGLTWQSQSKVIRAELDEVSAKALIELLARDTPLRHAARSPLMLKGLLAQAKKGAVASSSVFDLLGAVIDAFEEDDQRRLSLKEPPLDSQHRHFLEALASHLTSKQETTTSCREILPVISATAKQLVDDGQFGSTRPSDVLDALSNRHLLHADGQTIRFAHQRFQEYFAATCLFRACVDGGEHDLELLSKAVNQPFWEDALRLVAGKLKGTDGYTQARSRLVRAALRVDLGFACDLAGACAHSETDDSDLCRDLVAQVNLLCDSPLQEVANYGVGCLIASGFTVFANRLWPLIESDDEQIRFNTYPMNGGITLKQLGADAETRIAAWSPERRTELLHELANNPDNYDFLVQTANEAAEREIRAAAIAALTWNFPASEAALQAWLKAPVGVQLEHNVISVVEYALEQGVGSDEVREKLRSLAREHSTDESLLKLALAFPDEVGPNAIEVILTRLREIKHPGDDAPLVALAREHAPDRLNALARELVLSERVVPDWACKIVQQESTETRAEVFEAVWGNLHSDGAQHLSAQAVGALANREQTLRSVRKWLNHCQDRRRDLPEAERERERHLGYLLANAPGDDLLSIVMELGESASYHEASELLDLVRGRIGRDGSRSSETTQWLPSSEAVRTLIATFGEKSDDEKAPQHKVHVFLCCIASHVAPAEFGDLLLDGCRLHLDAWKMFDTVCDEWLKHRIGDRPSNPSLGNYLVSAMENWGFGALPGLLELLDHPQANQLIPKSVERIVRRPWVSKEEVHFRTIEIDFKDGEERRLAGRVLRQPDDTHQEMTDVAARALGKKLTELVHQLRAEQAAGSANWGDKHAAYRMRGLLSAVANTPSPEIIASVFHALTNGFIDVFSAVGALKGLIRQGAFIEDPAVIARIEALYAEEAKTQWLDDSMRYALAELCQLMFFVRPASLLSKPLSDYLVEWQRFAHINEIIRRLGIIPSNKAWRCLLELGRTSAAKGRPPEELTSALAAALSPDHFTEFLDIVSDGTWFVWCQSAWNLERIAPSVIRVIGKDLASLDAFLMACERSGSPLADGFACAVLTLIPDGDTIRLRYGLAALDAGKAGDSRRSVYSMLKGMFTRHVSLGAEGHYEVHPKACNDLRRQLYIRARGNGLTATICKRLLAEVECQRREGGRPTDEPRHPAEGDGIAWTEALTIAG